MSLEIDHIIWAVPDLAEGISTFERLTGVRPAEAGHHPELGTCNALASLGSGRYLEVIAPSPGKAFGGNLGETLALANRPGWLSFALKSPDLDALARQAERIKLPFSGPIDGIRQDVEGRIIRWRYLFTNDTPFGWYLPFYIDWGAAVHPSTVTPAGLELIDFEVFHDKPKEIQSIYDAMGIGMKVHAADKPGFKAVLKSPKGTVELR